MTERTKMFLHINMYDLWLDLRNQIAVGHHDISWSMFLVMIQNRSNHYDTRRNHNSIWLQIKLRHHAWVVSIIFHAHEHWNLRLRIHTTTYHTVDIEHLHINYLLAQTTKVRIHFLRLDFADEVLLNLCRSFADARFWICACLLQMSYFWVGSFANGVVLLLVSSMEAHMWSSF